MSPGRVDPADAVRDRGTAPAGLVRTACPLCGGGDLRRTLRLRDRWLLTCGACGARATDAYADGPPLADYYTEVEAHHGKLGDALADREGALRAIAREQADGIEALCGPRRHGRILEIGCGRGHLLAELEERGWDVAGIELSRRSAVEAAGRIHGSVHVGSPEDAPFAPASFDRVGLFDVLAHLAEPRRTLARIAELLAPGGELVLSTVNEAWPPVPALLGAFRLAPTRTAALRDEMYEGQHYCYFGAHNVGRLLDAVGLRLVEARPLLPLSARYFVHQYAWPRRAMLLAMTRLDRALGSSRKMLVLARKPRKT